MKKLGQCIGFLLVILLAGCMNESSPDDNALAESTYLYIDMEVASGYVSTSYVEALTFGEVWMPSSKVSDGVLIGKSQYYGSGFSSLYGGCDENYDWKAETGCDWSLVLNGRYVNGAEISVTQTLGGADVESTFAFDELPALTSPLNGESYNSSDTLIVNWPTGGNGWEAKYIRFIPCADETFGYSLFEMDEDNGSHSLEIEDVISRCGVSGGELAVEIGYIASGNIDKRIAGGRFRVRVYSEPTLIELAQ